MTSLETNVKYELYKNETLKIKPITKDAINIGAEVFIIKYSVSTKISTT